MNNEQYGEMMKSLGRIEQKVEATAQTNTKQTKRLGELDTRVSALERGKAWMMGVFAALTAIATFLGLDDIKGWFNHG